MNGRVRRWLFLGGLGVMALGAGTLLGRFTVAGLSGSAAPMNEMAQLQAFAAHQRAEEAKRLPKPTNASQPLYDDPHVCQGCDTHRTGNFAMAPTDADEGDLDDAPAEEPADDQ